MAERMPKDYLLAERAYNAFWEEQPQIFFDQLSDAYQMRWVRAIRGAIEGHKSYQHSAKSGVLVGVEPIHRVLVPAKVNGKDPEAPHGRKANGKPYKTSAADRKRSKKNRDAQVAAA